MSGSVEGEVAVVTGAAQGIGNAIAKGLAAEGARIVVADLNRAEEAAEEFDGGVGVTVDVADEARVERMAREVIERCGRIDILVNNAGLYASLEMRPFTEIPVDEWRRVMDVNVLSMFLTTRAVVPHMREQGGGRIVNISSGTPFRGVPFLLHYVTSKGAIVALTRALAKELGRDDMLVNCVAPGFTMSEGVRRAPGGDRGAARRLGLGADDATRPGAGGRRRRGGLPLRAGGLVRDGPDDRHRRRPVLSLILALYEHPDGVDTTGGNVAVYDFDRNAAYFGAASVPGRALVWRLEERLEEEARLAAAVELDPGAEWLLRCDRVDFPPGGIAHRHTHPGPGIRYLLHGSIRIESGGGIRVYGPLEPWFESGPEPVLAFASEAEDTAFVRAMLVPREWAGKRTIRYVDPADECKPKLQRATVFFDEAIEL